MFDLTSSKLLILAVVALIVVGPKDLPALLRTLGYYMGMIRRQANEFRSQFEDAMRETELAQLKKEVEDLGRDTKATLDETTRSIETQVGDVGRDLNQTFDDVARPLGSPSEGGVHSAPAETAAAVAEAGDATSAPTSAPELGHVSDAPSSTTGAEADGTTPTATPIAPAAPIAPVAAPIPARAGA